MRRIFSWIMIGVVLSGTGIAAAQAQAAQAQAAQAPQQSPAGVEAVMAYAGTWKVHGEHFATAYSQVGKEDKTLRNDCWKSGAYVACNQYVDGDSKVLLIFTYSDKDKMYTTYQIPQSGEAAGSGRLQDPGKHLDVSLAGDAGRDHDVFPRGERVHGNRSHRLRAGVFTGQRSLDGQWPRDSRRGFRTRAACIA